MNTVHYSSGCLRYDRQSRTTDIWVRECGGEVGGGEIALTFPSPCCQRRTLYSVSRVTLEFNLKTELSIIVLHLPLFLTINFT